MSKGWILANIAIMPGMMAITPFLSEDMLCFAIEILALYLFSYFIRSIGVLCKSPEINKSLLLIPVLMIVVFYLYIETIIGLQRSMDESIFSYINVSDNHDVTCRNNDVCSIDNQHIVIHRYIEKNYTISRENGCLKITSIYTRLTEGNYFRYEKCPVTEASTETIINRP
ncbi:MAG: hypothetical protein LBU53_09860 [Zoogloeaceae bacterium]|jgi:hypothetical protein|nr:hypothetical protein [Zoogloeaceae bacterium]